MNEPSLERAVSGEISRESSHLQEPDLGEARASILATHWLWLVALAIVAIEAIHYQGVLLGYLHWEDEAETIVTARMIAGGGRLYQNIFSQHGPLVVLFGYLIEIATTTSLQLYRICIACLQWCGLVAILTSPIAGNVRMRVIFTIIAASVVVVLLPRFASNVYDYQSIAGLFVLIALAAYVVPAIGLGAPGVAPIRVALGNLLIASLPFLAVTYGPAAVLLFIAGLRREYVRSALLWAGIAVGLNVAFLIWKCSIVGYFVYHFYFNLFVYRAYSGGQQLSTTDVLIAAAVGAIAIRLLSRGSWRTIPWRGLCAVLAVSSLLIRGAGFQALPFYYGVLGCLLFASDAAASVVRRVPWLATIVVLGCMVKLSLLLPSDRAGIAAHPTPGPSPFATFVQAVTGRDDQIIAYTFANSEYIGADRLPASGHFFYLPAQAAYNAAPILGVKEDPCAEIRAKRPKVIYLDKWNMIDTHPWHIYASCIDDFVASDYTLIKGQLFYIRTDIAHQPEVEAAEAKLAR